MLPIFFCWHQMAFIIYTAFQIHTLILNIDTLNPYWQTVQVGNFGTVFQTISDTSTMYQSIEVITYSQFEFEIIHTYLVNKLSPLPRFKPGPPRYEADSIPMWYRALVCSWNLILGNPPSVKDSRSKKLGWEYRSQTSRNRGDAKRSCS